MKVFYDHAIFSRQVVGGISRYIVELINHLPAEITPILGLRASDNVYLRDLKQRHRYIGWKHLPERRKIYAKINGLFDMFCRKTSGYDILHVTDHSSWPLRWNKRPTVVTVHDLIFRYPGVKVKQSLVRKIEDSILNADALIAISETTRRDLVRFYDVPEEKIRVVHHGFTPCDVQSLAPSPISGRYILHVGERGGYKNFETLLAGFSKLSERDRSLKLVCTGKHFSSGEKRRIRELGVEGRVEQHLFPTGEMASLYAGAECFVFPSRLEGFGMPILEGFASRVPVIVSDSSCLPEIAGDGGIYFDPDDVDGLAAKIERVIEDKDFRVEHIEAGRRRLELFSWGRAAAETAEVYRGLLGN